MRHTILFVSAMMLVGCAPKKSTSEPRGETASGGAPARADQDQTREVARPSGTTPDEQPRPSFTAPPPRPSYRVSVTRSSVIVIDKVYFTTGSSVVSRITYPILDSIAQTMIQHPELTLVEVQGHTDSTEGKDSNEKTKLSQARADAVLKYLVNKGVAPARLQAKGYGDTRPVATNRTIVGRSKNRRVEFAIMARR